MHLEEWLESNWKWSPRPSIKIKAAQQKAISSQGGAACGGPEQQVGAAGKQPGEAAKQAAAQQRQPVSDEKVAADALLGLVRQSPDGRVVASRLCSELYKECPGAKSIITRYGGLKNFTASPMLAHVVQYEADERAGQGSVVLKWPISDMVLRQHRGAGGKQPAPEKKPAQKPISDMVSEGAAQQRQALPEERKKERERDGSQQNLLTQHTVHFFGISDSFDLSSHRNS